MLGSHSLAGGICANAPRALAADPSVTLIDAPAYSLWCQQGFVRQHMQHDTCLDGSVCHFPFLELKWHWCHKVLHHRLLTDMGACIGQ